MLMALTTGFALSQAFRTVAALMAPPLQQAFGLTPRELGLFAGVFHFAFGALQLVMGLLIDWIGPRRTVLAVFPLAIFGAMLTAMADSFTGLVIGQALTGIGCAPAFLVCTVFIARQFPAQQFAQVSGATLGIGSVGLLLTGTPLAWIIEAASWRAGFLALAACAALAWLAIWLLVREAPPPADAPRPSIGQALRGYRELFRLPFTWGIVGLGLFTYASFLALRGLWLGPLLVDRHGFSLVASGHVALAVSVVGMVGPPVFGRLDPGDARRRGWILWSALATVIMYAAMAFDPGAWVDVALALVMSVVAGFIVLQYADVRAAYPAAQTGRAMAIFTMAMFLGIAFMQWATGVAAAVAADHGWPPFAAVNGLIALLLLLGAAAFAMLPARQAA